MMAGNEIEENKKSYGGIKNTYYGYSRLSIPLLQRNYKWGMGTAAVLARDLIEAYCADQEEKTLGLLTLYEKDGQPTQIIDGQQRMISMALFECQINCIFGKRFESCFDFERDALLTNCDKRERCVEECLCCEKLFTCDKFLSRMN